MNINKHIVRKNINFKNELSFSGVRKYWSNLYNTKSNISSIVVVPGKQKYSKNRMGFSLFLICLSVKPIRPSSVLWFILISRATSYGLCSSFFFDESGEIGDWISQRKSFQRHHPINPSLRHEFFFNGFVLPFCISSYLYWVISERIQYSQNLKNDESQHQDLLW